jgi:hypothetical protein
MHGVGPGAAHGIEDLLDIEVGLGTRRTAQGDRDVGLADEGRVGVWLGVDGDRLDAHGARRAEDAAGDFTAVSDQNASNLSGHRDHIRKTP